MSLITDNLLKFLEFVAGGLTLRRQEQWRWEIWGSSDCDCVRVTVICVRILSYIMLLVLFSVVYLYLSHWLYLFFICIQGLHSNVYCVINHHKSILHLPLDYPFFWIGVVVDFSYFWKTKCLTWQKALTVFSSSSSWTTFKIWTAENINNRVIIFGISATGN